MSRQSTRPDSRPGAPSGQRVDLWLYYARLFKTRSLAAKLCRDRKLRVDGRLITKASVIISPGMVLTFPKAGRIRVVRVAEIGRRRGPAVEAQALYQDLSPAISKVEIEAGGRAAVSPTRPRGAGRPTKADRRALDRMKTAPLE